MTTTTEEVKPINTATNFVIDLHGTEVWQALPESIRTKSESIAKLDRFVLVELSQQKLWLYEDGIATIESKVIIGKRSRKTPILSTTANRITYNPTWYPTPSIIREGSKITPPGPNNPLGHFVLRLLNSSSIYIHGTNHPELFAQSNRQLSHGCIRTERIKEVAYKLTQLSDEEFEKRANSWVTYEEKIPSIPVFVTNWPFIYSKGKFISIPKAYA